MEEGDQVAAFLPFSDVPIDRISERLSLLDEAHNLVVMVLEGVTMRIDVTPNTFARLLKGGDESVAIFVAG